MSDKKIKVLSAGAAILDLLLNVKESFLNNVTGEKGGMELIPSEEIDKLVEAYSKEYNKVPVMAPGGSAANTINGLAKLNTPTVLLAKVGDDSDGEFYKKSYEANGGDSSQFRISPDAHTGRCASIVTPDAQRTMRTDLGASLTISSSDWDNNAFNGVTHMHMEGYLLYNMEFSKYILGLAKDAGCTVSLDLASFEVVNAVADTLKPLITEYIDIVFANEDEAEAFTGSTDPELAIGELSKYAKTAIVKVGKDGAYISQDGKTVKVDAIVVDAIDTTGAGDLWQAGFLYGHLNGKTPEESGKIASLLGAEVVKVMGATIPNDRWDYIKTKI
jgi:sugar/nucleoside kinase (ribokinase family)